MSTTLIFSDISDTHKSLDVTVEGIWVEMMERTQHFTSCFPVAVYSAGKVHMAQSLGNYSDILGASLLEAPSQLMFPGQAGYQTATHTPSFPMGSWRCQGQGSSPLP